MVGVLVNDSLSLFLMYVYLDSVLCECCQMRNGARTRFSSFSSNFSFPPQESFPQLLRSYGVQGDCGVRRTEHRDVLLGQALLHHQCPCTVQMYLLQIVSNQEIKKNTNCLQAIALNILLFLFFSNKRKKRLPCCFPKRRRDVQLDTSKKLYILAQQFTKCQTIKTRAAEVKQALRQRQ